MRIADDSTLVRQFEKQEDLIIAVAFSPDGRRVAVGGAAREVNLYDTDSGEKIAGLSGHEAVSIRLLFILREGRWPRLVLMAKCGFTKWTQGN